MAIYLVCRKCRSIIHVWGVVRTTGDSSRYFDMPTPGELFIGAGLSRCPVCGKPLEPPRGVQDIKISE